MITLRLDTDSDPPPPNQQHRIVRIRVLRANAGERTPDGDGEVIYSREEHVRAMPGARSSSHELGVGHPTQAGDYSVHLSLRVLTITSTRTLPLGTPAVVGSPLFFSGGPLAALASRCKVLIERRPPTPAAPLPPPP